jgi:hypothetical protein
VLKNRSTQLGLLSIAAMAVALLVARYAPFAIDWHLTFRPAALALLAGRSPYDAGVGFTNAPWALLPLLPMALLPENLGRGLLFVVTLAAMAVAAARLGAKPIALGAFLLSPPVVNELLNGNLNWMVVLGFTLPPQLGLFFMAIKPQVGFAVALFWAVEAWRAGGLRETLRIVWPVTLATLLSIVLFGVWPAHYLEIATISETWNASLWPSSIPAGLALIVAALRKREMRFAMAASPSLSPYVLLHAWAGALIALAPATLEMLAAVIGLWALVAIRALGL